MADWYHTNEIEVLYSQPNHDEIDREMVFEETSIETLKRWHGQLRVVESQITTMLASIKGYEHDGAPRMARKLGFVRIASNWIKARLEQLGDEAPDHEMGSKFARMKQHLTSATQSLATKNAKIKAQAARITELEAKLAERAK